MVQRWLILFCLLGYNTLISSQPVVEESNRDARGASGYDFVECCPCPKLGEERVGDAPCSSSGISCMVDSVGRSGDPDSAVSPSSDFSSQVRDPRPLMRSDDSQEERMPILKPEVDLASAVLETIREATEEEYRDALARDAARNAANAREPSSSDSRSNIVIIVEPERGDLTDAVQEASQIEEARWNEVPPDNFKTNLDSDVGASNRNDNIEDVGPENNVLAANNILKSVRDRLESVRNSLNIKRLPELSKKPDSNILGNLKPALPKLKDIARDSNDLTPQSTRQNEISQPSLTERLRNNPLIKNIHNLKDVELIQPQRNAADKNKIPNFNLQSLLRGNNENTDNNGFNLFHLPTLDELLHPPKSTTVKFDTTPSIIQEPGNQIENDQIDILDTLPGESQNNIVTTKAIPLSENTPNCDLEDAKTKQKENVEFDDADVSADELDSLESIENGSLENIQLDENNGDNLADSVEAQDNDSNISVDSQEFSEQNDAIPEPSTRIFETLPDEDNEKEADKLREKDPCISDFTTLSETEDINDKKAESSESSLLDNIKDQIKKLKDIHSSAKDKLRNTLNKKYDGSKKTKINDKEVSFDDLQKMSDSLLDSSNKANIVTDPKLSENTTPELTEKESTQILDEVNQSTEKDTHSAPDNCKSDIFLQNSDKKEPEMETGSSDAIMNIARPTFKTRPSLRRDFIVQPSHLRRDNDLPLLDLPALPSLNLPTLDLSSLPSLDLPSLDLPSLDLPSLDLPPLPSLDLPPLELPRLDMPSLELPRLDVPSLDLPSLDLPNLPSLDEIRDGIQNLFDRADTPTFMQRASEGLGSSLLSAASTPQRQSVLRPLDEINFDIFQLNPSALSRSSSKQSSLQPGFNLNSYRARVPLHDFQLQPLNLQSTTKNNGKVLGASISMKPKSKSRKSKQRDSVPLFDIHDHFKNFPSLGEMRDAMRSRAQNILESAPPLLSSPLTASPLGLSEPEGLASLRENLRSNAEDTFNNLQKSLAASVQQVRERNENILGTSKFAQPENVIETLALARENLDDTLKALHSDFNDRLSSIHNDGKAALSKTLKKSNLESPIRSAPKTKSNKKRKHKTSKPVISRGESKKSQTILPSPHSKPLQRIGDHKLRSEAPTMSNKKANLFNSPQQTEINKPRSSLTDLIKKHTNQITNKDSRIPKTKTDSILSSTNEHSLLKPKSDNRESNKIDSRSRNIFKDVQENGRSPFLSQRASFNEKPSLAEQIENLRPKIVLPNLGSSDFLRSTLERNSENQKDSFWPKSRVPDTSLINKFRESVKSLAESPLLSSPSKLTEPKTVKDLIQGASERAASLVAGPTLKENVKYKCKIVCERDDDK